jgi:hypothetical protein
MVFGTAVKIIVDKDCDASRSTGSSKCESGSYLHENDTKLRRIKSKCK